MTAHECSCIRGLLNNWRAYSVQLKRAAKLCLTDARKRELRAAADTAAESANEMEQLLTTLAPRNGKAQT